MTANKTAKLHEKLTAPLRKMTKKLADQKAPSAGKAKKMVEKLEHDLRQAGNKKQYNLGLPTSNAPGPMQIYVGIRETGAFLRTFEEHPSAEDLSYHIFSTNCTPTKKTHPFDNAIIGPFRTMAAARIFADREGVNTVEDAERLVR